MGPRSNERGKEEAQQTLQNAEFELQWGRALMSAERPVEPTRRENVPVPLQWGRALMSAESRPIGTRDPAGETRFNGAAL